MRYRRRLGKRYSRKLFRRTANRTHGKNLRSGPMRGGIRL